VSRRSEHIHVGPTWEECITTLLGKLNTLVAEGNITINDARAIQYLADANRAQPR
jgi:hypothetical protein